MLSLVGKTTTTSSKRRRTARPARRPTSRRLGRRTGQLVDAAEVFLDVRLEVLATEDLAVQVDTQITFTPDLKRFNMDEGGFDRDILALLHKRVWDMAFFAPRFLAAVPVNSLTPPRCFSTYALKSLQRRTLVHARLEEVQHGRRRLRPRHPRALAQARVGHGRDFENTCLYFLPRSESAVSTINSVE
jgi:hypothetical protein